jgi:hypothetical protein
MGLTNEGPLKAFENTDYSSLREAFKELYSLILLVKT